MAILGKTSVTSLEVLNQIKSNVATGTAPLAVNSTTVVSNLNADYLDGYHATTASVGNTVVVRTSEGYINTSFINTGIENQDNIDISAVYYEGYSDKFIRKCSPVRFRNYLISPYIKGAGATTVTTDSTTGTITISSTNTDTATTQSGHYTPSATASTVGATSGNNYIRGINLDSKKHVISVSTGTPTDTNTWRPVYNGVDSTDTSSAATANAVKTAYDKAVSAYNLANGKTSNVGTVTSVKVTGGTGLSGGGTVTSSGTITLKHAAAYTGTSLTKSTSGANYYLTGVTLTMDGLGHVTGISGGEAYDDNTNTHYTTRLYAGASGTAAHSAVTNPYLKVTDDNTYRNQVRFVGGGATTITSNSAGTITITSTDTNTDTKVTSAANHYNPGFTGTSITKSTSGANYYLTGVTLTLDGKGHVTALSGGESVDDNTTYTAGAGLTLSSGQFSVTAANASEICNLLGEGTSPAHPDDYIIAQYATGGTTTTTYHRRKIKNCINAATVKGGLGYLPTNLTGASGTVSNTTGTPSVSIATGGTASAQTLSFTFTNIKGAKGDKGDKGDTGSPGTNGTNGTNGKSVGSIVCTTGTGTTTTATTSTSAGATNYYRIKDTSGNWLSGGIAIKNGSNGTNGTNGTNGKDGTNGRSVGSLVCVGGSASTTTTTPSTANDGTSYYRVKDTAGNWLSGYIAVKNGSKGSKGSNGTNGTNGSDGADGRSVGSIVCVGGSASTTTTTPNTANEGTSYYRIKDTAGNWLSGYIAVKNGAKGSNGTNGTNGTNGKDGTNGSDGDDGFGIYFANATTQTGTTTISKSYITTNSRTPQIGDFILSYSGFLYKITSGWTTSTSYAYVSYLTTLKGANGSKGSPGTNGSNGSDGADGLSMFYCSYNYSSGQTSMSRSYLTPSATVKAPIKGDLVLTSGGLLFSVSSVSTSSIGVSYLTSLKGANGSNGSPGTNGTNGTNGLSVSQIVCTKSLTSTATTTVKTADGATNYYRFKDSSGGWITGGITVKNGSKGADGEDGDNGSSSITVTNSSTKGYIMGSNVSSGTLSAIYSSSSAYIASGNCYANAFYQTSDERLKEFYEDVEIDFDKLKSIPKKYFTWNFDDEKHRNLGTSAQKIKELYPEIVSYDEEIDKYSVAYDKLSIIALKAIDELHEENKTLKTIIEEMDKRLKALENLR